MEKVKEFLAKMSLNDYTTPHKIGGVIMFIWAIISLVGIAMTSLLSVVLYGSMGYIGYNLSVHGKYFKFNKMKLDFFKLIRSVKKIFLSKMI